LLAALGHDVGQSAFEPERLAEARSFIARARSLGVELILPSDVAVRTSSAAWVKGSLVQPAGAEEQAEIVAVGRVRAEQSIVDLGPESLQRVTAALARAKSALWWGALGRGLADSTPVIAAALAQKGALGVAIGTELRRSLGAVEPEVVQSIGLVSTGSSAAQALLGGRRLPGAEVLGDG
jgi:phosphoglycerate kinase